MKLKTYFRLTSLTWPNFESLMPGGLLSAYLTTQFGGEFPAVTQSLVYKRHNYIEKQCKVHVSFSRKMGSRETHGPKEGSGLVLIILIV